MRAASSPPRSSPYFLTTPKTTAVGVWRCWKRSSERRVRSTRFMPSSLQRGTARRTRRAGPAWCVCPPRRRLPPLDGQVRSEWPPGPSLEKGPGLTGERPGRRARVTQMKDFPQVNGWTVIALSGDLDDFAAHDVRRLLDALVDGGEARVVVDLAAVGFVDSTGLNALLSAARRARDGRGAVRLAGAVPRVRDVVELSGVSAVLPLYPDVAAACA
ncbi:STAS domain-containing protein [Streptomyces kaniharaensis]|uniref:Anti-sigma factor antagonist n=2 Tax=Streptomyces kaniharaensis TaxID=212423 RepID=A0A6N7L114_9ACTN|nr:STAS domain-containing protein [Streptomyces kaniharaensis]